MVAREAAFGAIEVNENRMPPLLYNTHFVKLFQAWKWSCDGNHTHTHTSTYQKHTFGWIGCVWFSDLKLFNFLADFRCVCCWKMRPVISKGTFKCPKWNLSFWFHLKATTFCFRMTPKSWHIICLVEILHTKFGNGLSRLRKCLVWENCLLSHCYWLTFVWK